MLLKSARDGMDWDTLIPYLQLAYLEVQQDWTGISPFKIAVWVDCVRPNEYLERVMGGEHRSKILCHMCN